MPYHLQGVISMQLVTLALIVGSLWVLFGQGERNMRTLPWRWIVLWSVLGGAANAEVSLIFSQQQGGRLGSFIFTILILGLVLLLG